MWSMVTKIKCNEDITAANESEALKSVTKNGCAIEIEMEHEAGCPTNSIDTDAILGWLYDHEWVIGLIYLIFGPLVALFGVQWFPYVCAALVCIFTFGAIVFGSLSFGLMVTTTGNVVTFILALIVGVLVGMLVRRKIWVMVGLLGLVAGFFSGSLLFALIYSMTGLEAVWLYWVLSVVMCGLGCVAACYLGKTVVLTSTSLVGSYLFMRSWTLFFPGSYPSETELVNDYEDLELDSTFWIYIAVFFVAFAGSMTFQCKHAKVHEELEELEDDDDDYQKQ